MAEMDGLRIAAVFAADAALEVFVGLAAELHGHVHQLADAAGVQRLERIRPENAGLFLVHVVRQEAAGVIARESHGGLCEIVGAEGEEFRDLSDFPGQQGCAGKLDHRSDQVGQVYARLFDDLVSDPPRRLLENREFLSVQSKRMHDLR